MKHEGKRNFCLVRNKTKFNFIYLFIYLEREWERVSRGRGRERESQAGSMVSTESDTGLDLTTWSKIKSQMPNRFWATQAPQVESF